MSQSSILSKSISFGQWKAIPKGSLSVRLTPSGWGFSGLILCLFLMSINFSNNLIFAMTFLMVSIACVGWYHTRINVRGLRLGEWHVQPVFAGQTISYRVSVTNPISRMRHGIMAKASGHQKQREQSFSANEQLDVLLDRAATERGRLTGGPAHLQSVFPLGIFEVRLAASELPECLVYPKPEGGQPLPDRLAGRDAHLSAESGSFTEMRRYAPGDSLSHINWKAMARFDELYTKEFDGAEGKPALWLRWEDVTAGGVESKLSQLCQWVLEVHQQNREFGLELPGLSIEPASSEAHMKRCLEALACYGMEGKDGS